MSREPVSPARQGALFGKLPAHGDFVRRGDPALVRRLDAWLTGEVERLARGKGDALDTILAGLPVWCFVLPEGLAGALGASHDRVGRVFPLVCCAGGGRAVAQGTATLVAGIEVDGLDADTLAAEIADLHDLPAAADGVAVDDETPRWWCMSGEAPTAIAIAGLPTGADFDRLFDVPDPQDAS